MARLTFIGLLNFCDDNGIHTVSSKRLKMEVYPSDPFSDIQVNEWMSELISHGLVKCYSVGEHQYWWVTGWHKHQRIDKPTYRHPLPDGSFNRMFSESDRLLLDEYSPSPRVRSRKESKGEETNRNESEEKFDMFWLAYPNKIAKPAAIKAWGKEKINGEFPQLMDALEKHKLTEKWQKDGGKYIPNPATWINQRRWEDEIGGSNGSDLMAGVT